MTNDLTNDQAARMAALDCVLHCFRGQAAEDMPDTVDLLAMAEWVHDGTAELAQRVVDADVRREAELEHGHAGGFTIFDEIRRAAAMRR